MDSSTSTRIPVELYRPIIAYVDQQSLIRLCTTSKTIQHEAEVFLYAIVTSPSGDYTLSHDFHLGFLTTINQSQHLGKFVKEYTVTSGIDYEHNPVWSLLIASLRKMPNLRMFHFYERMHSTTAAEELLLDVPFKLNALHWEGPYDEHSMDAILIQQQDLKVLSITGGPKVKFSDQACPHLRRIRGNRQIVESLLPKRSVTEVIWVPVLDDSKTDPLTGMESELSSVKSFSLGGRCFRPSLSLFAHHLKSLEVLHLYGWFYYVVRITPKTDNQLLIRRPDRIAQEETIIQHITTLRKLVISIAHSSGVKTNDKRQKLAGTYFATLPRLESIYIQDITGNFYYRWFRRDIEKDKVSLDIVNMESSSIFPETSLVAY